MFSLHWRKFFYNGNRSRADDCRDAFFKVAHPPAGSNPIAIFLAGPDWSFLVTPTLAGALVIVALGIAYNNVRADRAYPKYW